MMNPGKHPAITTSRKTFRHAVEYAFVQLFYALLQLWPHSFRRELAGLFGGIAYFFTPRRVKIATENLRASFPQLSDREVKRIARQVYCNLAASAIEVIDPESAVAMVRVDTETKTRLQLLSRDHEQGKPLLIVTGHYGNWEILGQYLVTQFNDIGLLAKEQSNPYVDRMINRQRTSVGGRIITSRSAAREVPRMLKSGGCIFMAVDQDAGSGGVMIKFLGRTAAYFRGWALFSLHYQVPVVFALLRRESGGFVLELSDTVIPDCTADKGVEIRRLLTLFSDYLAAAVTDHPEQWLWTHRRWKSGIAESESD